MLVPANLSTAKTVGSKKSRALFSIICVSLYKPPKALIRLTVKSILLK